MIVIGNVPQALSDERDTENDSYGWGNHCLPADYSIYYEYIKTPAYFAAQLCNKLCGLPSLECKYTKSENSAVCCVSALDASKNKLYILLCNHYFERGISSKLSINLKFDGINPSEDCTIYRIDELHNNFSAKWLEISKHIPRIESAADFDILGSAAETEISKTLAGEGLALWKNFKNNYSFNELTGEKNKIFRLL